MTDNRLIEQMTEDILRPEPVDLIIIGGGPAGLAAAVTAWDRGCRSLLLLERDDRLGGILNQCIHNGFGLHRYKEELTGPEYAARDIYALLKRRIPFRCNTMVLSITREKTVTTVSPQDGLRRYSARAIILAMGCRERPRGALGIPGSRCAGIMTTGTAQRLSNLEGYMPGEKIVILGSGDIGLIMARRMTFEGAKVIACVEIMPFSSGLTRNVVQCLDDFGIPLLLNHTVVEIHGRERLEGVTIAAVDPGTRRPLPDTARKIECDTLLLSVGLIPENELTRQAGADIDELTRGPVVDQEMKTAVAGIFACGNVLHVHDLVDEVSAEAERAAASAVNWLQQKFASAPESIAVRDGQGVRGVVPQYIVRQKHQVPKRATGEQQSLRLTFRPDAVYRHTAVRIDADDKMLMRRKKLILTPGEMVQIDLDPELLPQGDIGQIIVSVEGVKEDG